MTQPAPKRFHLNVWPVLVIFAALIAWGAVLELIAFLASLVRGG